MSKKARVKGKGAEIFFSEDVEKEDAQPEVTTPENARGRLVEALTPHVQPLSSIDFRDLADTELIKATFYFTQTQIDALEKAVFALRQEHRIKTNKSEVMRIALDEIIRKFEENQSDSALLKRLA